MKALFGRLRRRKGSALVLNLFAVALFASLGTVVFLGARTQVKTSVWVERQAQAQLIAEAGLEDAMHSLYLNSAWRTGFTQKAFAGGYYTVTLSTGTPSTVISTGYASSVALMGRALRSVTMSATTSASACPYALMADDVTIDGKLDAYDATTTLFPCSTCFSNGANVWANDHLTIGGATCPPVRLRGSANLGNGNSLSGSASCVESGVVSSTANLILPNYSGAGISNFTVSNGSTVTLYPGSYYYKKITVKGVLNVDTSTGTVYMYFDSNVDADGSCQINNFSKIPSRLHITDISGNSGHTIKLNCTATPLHAYLEGNTNNFEIAQEVYGHYCGGSVDISSAASGRGIVHYDIGGGAVTHVSAATWTESYKRQ